MSEGSDVAIRPAAAGDGPEIANVHLNSWREAYRGLLPQEFLDQLPMTFKRRMSWWNKVLSETDAIRLCVADTKSGIVGFSCFQPARDESLAGLGELSAIYLFERYKGRGIGRALLEAGMKRLLEDGIEKAYCWVLEGNPTISFYEKSGARFNGMSKTAEIGGQTVKELAYQWDDLKRAFG